MSLGGPGLLLVQQTLNHISRIVLLCVDINEEYVGLCLS